MLCSSRQAQGKALGEGQETPLGLETEAGLGSAVWGGDGQWPVGTKAKGGKAENTSQGQRQSSQNKVHVLQAA